MKNFLFRIIFVTIFALLYVYQQTEVFRLAYVAQKKQTAVNELLDKNSILRYNIEHKSSLVHISGRLSSSADFQMPDSYRYVKMPPERQPPAPPAARENLIARIFTVKRQAEAHTDQ